MQDPTARPKGRRLLDPVRDVIRLRHYSYRTEQSYVSWIRRFIQFHGKHHAETMAAAEIREFLTCLAVRAARLTKPASSHTFRHCFALHFLQPGDDNRTVQEWPGDSDVKPTMIAPHVLNRGGRAVRSPLDRRDEPLACAA